MAPKGKGRKGKKGKGKSHGKGDQARDQASDTCLPGDVYLKSDMFSDPWEDLMSKLDPELASLLTDSPQAQSKASLDFCRAPTSKAATTPKSGALICQTSSKSSSISSFVPKALSLMFPAPVHTNIEPPTEPSLSKTAPPPLVSEERQKRARSPDVTLTCDAPNTFVDRDELGNVIGGGETPSALLTKLRAIPKARPSPPLRPVSEIDDDAPSKFRRLDSDPADVYSESDAPRRLETAETEKGTVPIDLFDELDDLLDKASPMPADTESNTYRRTPASPASVEIDAVDIPQEIPRESDEELDLDPKDISPRKSAETELDIPPRKSGEEELDLDVTNKDISSRKSAEEELDLDSEMPPRISTVIIMEEMDELDLDPRDISPRKSESDNLAWELLMPPRKKILSNIAILKPGRPSHSISAREVAERIAAGFCDEDDELELEELSELDDEELELDGEVDAADSQDELELDYTRKQLRTPFKNDAADSQDELELD